MTHTEKNRARRAGGKKGGRIKRKPRRKKRREESSSDSEEERGLFVRGGERRLVPQWVNTPQSNLNPRDMMMMGASMYGNNMQMGVPGTQMTSHFAGAAQEGGFRQFKGYCLQCGQKGHKRMNCPELTAEERRAFPPCPHCGLTGHKPDFCFELEQNASRRPYGWVSKNNNNAFCQPTDRTVTAGNLTSSGGNTEC